ncbi:hypothetical protein AAG906_032573 [Vitis piasezkii]
MIFSQLFSLKNIEENKRKREGKGRGKFYRAHGIRISVLSSDQVGSVGSGGKQGAILKDLGWVLADATPPTTPAKFTLDRRRDFYNVSLIDGRNSLMITEGSGWSECARRRAARWIRTRAQ